MSPDIAAISFISPTGSRFAATGVTSGTMLQGVRRIPGGAVTHSMVMRSKSGTVRIIEAQHNFTRKIGFLPTEK